MKTLSEGVYAAATTPRRLGLQDIHLGVMWELIDFLQERKVDGIVLMGATGEFVHYAPEERMRMMGLASKRSRVPVIFNVSHSTLDGAVELGQAAGASGAAAVLLMPPYFFRYSREEIQTFYQRFAANTGLSIPILVYNIPQFGNPVPADLSLEMLRDGTVHGVKDSAPSGEGLQMLSEARHAQSFPLFVGNDSLFIEAFGWGISGAISGIASAVPELVVALGEALTAGNEERVQLLAARMREFIAWIEKFPTPVGIREATCLRGLPLGPNASPAGPKSKLLLEEFREWFRPWLKAVVAETRLA